MTNFVPAGTPSGTPSGTNSNQTTLSFRRILYSRDDEFVAYAEWVDTVMDDGYWAAVSTTWGNGGYPLTLDEGTMSASNVNIQIGSFKAVLEWFFFMNHVDSNIDEGGIGYPNIDTHSIVYSDFSQIRLRLIEGTFPETITATLSGGADGTIVFQKFMDWGNNRWSYHAGISGGVSGSEIQINTGRIACSAFYTSPVTVTFS